MIQRYNIVNKLKDVEETQVIGILVGTVVVPQYRELIVQLKSAIEKAGKKAYEVLVGKINEPKLKNISMVDAYVIVSCKETSFYDPKEFYTTICTPHELFMALSPVVFPWGQSILTDFREVMAIQANFDKKKEQGLLAEDIIEEYEQNQENLTEEAKE